ncbi:MAG TPA: hypothetical protein VLJ42_00380 [Solirubrobacteraceae bacterium]|nr:hypothetical protein [Solirubrobacteraceae bacterium]
MASAAGGVAALVAGLVMRSHYEPIKRLCDSGLGALGQAFNPSAQQHCSLDSSLAVIGTCLAIVGVCTLGLALLNLREARKPRRANSG